MESQKTTLTRLSNCLDTAEQQRISLLNDLDEERCKNSHLKAQSVEALEATPINNSNEDPEVIRINNFSNGNIGLESRVAMFFHE